MAKKKKKLTLYDKVLYAQVAQDLATFEAGFWAGVERTQMVEAIDRTNKEKK